MTLTEQDGALALRGYVLSRTGVLPTDPDFVALCRDETMLRFCAHWLRKREDDWFEMLSKLLGVVWKRRDVERMLRGASVSTRPDDVFIPLALGCNPQLSEQLKELFVPKSGPIAGGEYLPEPGEEIVELGDHYQFLLSTGVPDTEITDGRLAVLHLSCCGGKISEQQSIWIYVPPSQTVEAEDFVEVRMGRVPDCG